LLARRLPVFVVIVHIVVDDVEDGTDGVLKVRALMTHERIADLIFPGDVVHLATLGVRERLVRGADLLEAVFRIGVAWVSIGVTVQAKLLVGFARTS
jgi:hypothetical protein